MVITKGMESTEAYVSFMKRHFRTKEDILKSIDKKIDKYEKTAKEDRKTPAAFYSMLDTLIHVFKERIEQAVLFDELPDWWVYDYDLEYDRFVLRMEHVREFDADDETSEDYHGAIHDASYPLIGFSLKTVTAGEYAELFGVGDGTVRQWIRRGKLRTATKVGNEWRIPVLTVPPSRGYEGAQYIWQELADDIPEEYQYLNNFKLATFYQDRSDREKYHVLLVAKETTGHEDLSANRELILDAKEREKLELFMISRPEIRFSLRY